MKKVLIILVFIWGFVGCKGLLWDGVDLDNLDIWRDAVYTLKARNHTLYYHPDFEIIQTLDDISRFVMNAVDYRLDVGDTWSDPEETYARGWGDCDDMDLLANNIAKVMFDIEYHVILIDHSIVTYASRVVVNGGLIDHMMSYYEGYIYEAQQSMIIKKLGNIAFIYYFDQVFIKVSPSYTEYLLTKVYELPSYYWEQANDILRPYIHLNNAGDWIIITP